MFKFLTKLSGTVKETRNKAGGNRRRNIVHRIKNISILVHIVRHMVKILAYWSTY